MRLSQEGEALVGALGDRTTHTLSALEQARHQLARSVKDMNDQLSGSASQLGETVETTTAEATRRLSGQKAALAHSVEEMTTQLHQSSASLSEIVDGAVMNLATLDQNIARSARSFSDATQQATSSFDASSRLIDTNTTKLSNLSSKTLSDIGSIAHSFSEHGKMLQNASDLLGSAQSNLTATLEERQTAIESLTKRSPEKSERDRTRHAVRSRRSSKKTIGEAEGARSGRQHSKLRAPVGEVVEMAGSKFRMRRTKSAAPPQSSAPSWKKPASELKRGVNSLPEGHANPSR